jgi:hypothetical protein
MKNKPEEGCADRARKGRFFTEQNFGLLHFTKFQALFQPPV